MLIKIRFNNYNIYTEEIIHPEEFCKLYKKEQVLIAFKTKVNNVHNKKPFATFLAKERHLAGIKEGEYIVFRIVKGKEKFEFVSKIGKWGKFHVFKTAVEKLNINNHNLIKFEVIKSKERLNTKTGNIIDLVNLQDKANIIFRENNLITIIRKGTIPITLPRFIKITPDLIELCFLIHGDGHYKYKLYFANKNPELHRFVIEKFEWIFGIPKAIWRARLLISDLSNQESAKENWIEILNLDKEQFYPSVSKSMLKTSDLGNLRIVIDKTIVSSVFRYIFEQLQNLKGKQAIHALNGLLYAEGGARRNKNGLHKITLSFNQEEKKIFQDILVETGINKVSALQENRMFVISGWERLHKFFKIFFLNNIIPFNLHQERCKKALSGFLNHGFTKTMHKYLSVLNKRKSMDTNELITELGHLPNSIIHTLRKEQYRKFVNISGKGINKSPFIFTITPEGREFLMLIKNIKEVYNGKCFK